VRPNGRTLRIAHRGASAHAPENTLAAIRQAAAFGADMVEVDLQASADGVLVVMHDPDLSRTTNGSGSVYAQTLAELQRLDAGGGERIPTAEEVIACCREHDLGIYFELKIGFAAEAIVPLIRHHALHERVIVASFRPDWLAEVVASDAAIATSVLFGSPHVDAVALAAAAGARYVHPCWEHRAAEPHRLLTPEWLARVRTAGLGIISWHEERPSEIAALRRLGLDGLCSNAPELLLDATPAAGGARGPA
jgi:glycerophosphoryl diester phosphodiesterase